MRKKVCFIIQRYGLEVNGGAELHCRQFAEHLSTVCDVNIMTTKAVDYITWKNEYSNDVDDVNGLTVYRFPVARERDLKTFNKLNDTFETKIIGNKKKELDFIKKQGPYCPQLVKEIKKRKDQYDVFIFYTYLYYTTILGIKAVMGKAILIPTAHDEPFIKMSILQDVFHHVKALFYNTELERKIVESIYQNGNIKNDIGGIGITVESSVNPQGFKEKHKLGRYIIYVGRIEGGKLCQELFRAFGQYKRDYPSDLKLVLVGKSSLPIPKTADILPLGFVSDEEKFDAIAGAMALVLPSQFESLSMVVLEAMKLQVPVLVNGKCAVTKEHCLKSNGGLYYNDYLEFEECLEYLSKNPDARKQMGENGRKYVESQYSWDIMQRKLEGLINYVCENSEAGR